MRGDVDSAVDAQGDSTTDDAIRIERRMFRTMIFVVALAVLFSLFFFTWRVTVGLIIGGALALLNYHWLRSSIAAIFSNAGAKGVRPKLATARYVLRYFVVACAIASAYFLNIASLVAMLAGLSAFAWAGLMEGFIQTYFAIVKREET